MDGWRLLAVLDMGWEDIKVAVEYDGDHHRTNRAQYAKDQRRIRELERLGWIVIGSSPRTCRTMFCGACARRSGVGRTHRDRR